MPKVMVYNAEGSSVGERELDGAVFGVAVKPSLLQLALVAQDANARKVIAHTKDRSEVRGGGKKPWKQKHTGRARHGSIRSPIWVGGGVTFGPNNLRNFSLKLNKKVRRSAIRMGLSNQVREGHLVALDTLDAKLDKTKAALTLLRNLKLRPGERSSEPGARSSGAKDNVSETGSATPTRRLPKVLVVLPSHSAANVRAFRNLPRVSVITADSLNVRALLGHQYLLMPWESCQVAAKVYAARSSVKRALAAVPAGRGAQARTVPAKVA